MRSIQRLFTAAMLCTGMLTIIRTEGQTINTLPVYSQKMGKEIKNILVLPPGYETGADRYPVVYILHGYSGNYRAVLDNGNPDLARASELLQCILVCPDGGYNSWYWDSPVDPTSQYETYITRELIGYIDANYRTRNSREGRAITGYSMGGHGALWLTFRHPDIFGAAGSMCGGVDIRSFPQNWDMKEKLGPYHEFPERWDEHTVITQLYRITPSSGLKGNRKNPALAEALENQPAIIFDCGTDDFFYDVNVALHEEMLRRNIQHDFISRPGVHNSAYWNNALHYQLLFFHAWFNTRETE